MKRFDLEKVKEVAIDKPNHRQIYVLDKEKRKELINLLKEMGFAVDGKSLSKDYAHLPFAVNVDEKRFFSVGSVAIITCSVQCGAKVLNMNQMSKLIAKTQ